MALSASVLAGLIQANLVAFGARGSNLTVFCNAVAAGIVESIVGAEFGTSDVGTVPGFGSGIGTGITGLSASTMESIALSFMPTTGSNAANLMNAIMNAVVTHLGEAADLTSDDSPVFMGVGTIVPGGIGVVESEMASNIDSQLAAVGANGSNRTVLADAIAQGVTQNLVAAGTGTLTITGSATGTPGPGTGGGFGSIS
jgi:hypothetical protein